MINCLTKKEIHMCKLLYQNKRDTEIKWCYSLLLLLLLLLSKFKYLILVFNKNNNYTNFII
ncbi:MAG: hypothetical protein N7Q72_01585 [Spiroplasma sp. Tabriz.8]|nr:hypothetical protein [Spiroplasma sp. Tabriz.8]